VQRLWNGLCKTVGKAFAKRVGRERRLPEKPRKRGAGRQLFYIPRAGYVPRPAPENALYPKGCGIGFRLFAALLFKGSGA